MTPAQVVAIAEISQYLWDCSIPKQNVFYNGSIDPRKAQQLYMERIALQYGIEQNLGNIDGVSNYVLALCGAKLQLAKEIYETGSAGGSVIPGGGGSQSVREYSAYASPGSTTITFTGAINAQLLYASRGGFDVGAFIYSGLPTGNDVLWNSSTGTLTVAADVPFVADEYVRILVK